MGESPSNLDLWDRHTFTLSLDMGRHAFDPILEMGTHAFNLDLEMGRHSFNMGHNFFWKSTKGHERRDLLFFVCLSMLC